MTPQTSPHPGGHEQHAANPNEIRCPTSTRTPDGTLHSIIGCGSTNVTGPDDEGLYDCGDCGIWFDPTVEPQSRHRQDGAS